MLAIAGGLGGIVHTDAAAAEVALSACLWCIGRALTLGAAPALLACAFIVYAAVRHPGLGTALAIAGGVAPGAAAVHATCPSDRSMHWILAHTLVPVAAVVVLTAPLAALLAGWTRRG